MRCAASHDCRVNADAVIRTGRSADCQGALRITALPLPATRGTCHKEPMAGIPACRAEWSSAMSTLLKWALIMFIVSLVAALFGFTNLSAASADVARILFYIFLVIFLVLLVLGLLAARAVSK